MSKRSFIQFGVAIVVLAAVLIFLGVNYVPRIFASSSSQRNTVVDINQSYILHSHNNNAQYQPASAIQIRPDYLDERYPRAIFPANKFLGSDWIEGHPSTYSAWLEHRSSQPSQ